MIRSFEIITLRLSGMRGISEYEITDRNGTCTVSFYQIRYSNSKDERVLEEQAVIEEAAMLKLLNECHVLKWDGFEGKHPKWVRDGIMFSFEAIVNDHQKITARGSENFPKYYREFLQGLNDFLQEEKKKDG